MPLRSACPKFRDALGFSAAALALAFQPVAAWLSAAGEGGPSPAVHLEFDAAQAVVRHLSWDSEGGERVSRNLLRESEGLSVRLRSGGAWARGADGVQIRFAASSRGERASFVVSLSGERARDVEAVELRFSFDPRVTPTTAIPSKWEADGTLRLPVALVAPDFGAALLREAGGAALSARLEGSRAAKTVDLRVELPREALLGASGVRLELEPFQLAPPEGLQDVELWRRARRGWLGAFQPSAAWGDPGNPFSAPAGILANNVISDPASSSLWFYADQALFVPEIAPGIRPIDLVRRSIDWWLSERTRPSGEVVCYWDYGDFLDANAGPIIAAWDYFEATGDRSWVEGKIERLEFVARFLARRDVDGDGLIEAVQSGNRGTLIQPKRSCAWWDALNCGGKDAYSNAIIYRAFACLGELESRLGRAAQAAEFRGLARKLKAAYRAALFDPEKGWLGWWRSSDGELHDFASPTLNGIAIEYGLVEPEEGRAILERLWKKIEEAGFERFDLGVPPMLVPVPRGDYLLPDSIGCPKREDGADTFGQYMNGGITAGQVLHFLAAHFVAGGRERAERVLRAMLGRLEAGGFQNGVVDEAGKGIDWTTWEGKPSGYEGYLADSFRFLQAVLLREPSFRARYYRPLRALGACGPTDDGYRGIWFELGQRSEFGDKYSGGLGTYTAKHVPLAVYSERARKTFFVYGGAKAGGKHLLAMVSYYDHERGVVPRPTIVCDKGGVADPHDNPSIALDGDGRVWVFVSGRARIRPGFKYRSLEPFDISAFELVSEEEMTYPQPWWLEGRGFLLLFTKYTKGRELYWSRGRDGWSWTEARKLAGMGGHYQVSCAAAGRVLTAFNWHPDGNVDRRTNLYYLETADMGETWATAAGRQIATPLEDPASPALVRDFRAEGRLVYLKDLNVDAAGRPAILFLTSSSHEPGPKGEPRVWTVARWTGERWEFFDVARSDHNYDMGSLYSDPEGVWRIIAPTEPGPQPWGTGGEMALWRSDDGGRSWRRLREITGGSARNHAYARRPLGAHPDFFAFWADGDPYRFSPSCLYFTNRDGDRVYRLPYDMPGETAVPELVSPPGGGERR